MRQPAPSVTEKASLKAAGAHKLAAEGLGRVALMLARRALSRHTLREVANRLRQAADDLEAVADTNR